MRLRLYKPDPLERLEREANDEFHLLEELGPQQFGGEHLLELRDKTRLRMEQFDRLSRLNLVVGSTASGWLLLGAIALWAKSHWIGQIAFAVMMLTIAAFLVGVFLLKTRYESRGELEYTLRIIEEELKKRQQKVRG